MKWHCGILSERPELDRTLQWVKRGHWDTGLPEDVKRELRIWLAMPGFSAGYHAQVLGVDRRLVSRFMGGYDEYRKEVCENWLSATREDCVKLAHLRGYNDIPVICQIQMMSDIKAGLSQAEVRRQYRVSNVTKIAKGRIMFRGELPIGFSLLGGRAGETHSL